MLNYGKHSKSYAKRLKNVGFSQVRYRCEGINLGYTMIPFVMIKNVFRPRYGPNKQKNRKKIDVLLTLAGQTKSDSKKFGIDVKVMLWASQKTKSELSIIIRWKDTAVASLYFLRLRIFFVDFIWPNNFVYKKVSRCLCKHIDIKFIDLRQLRLEI